jgi:hypothetical protein
MAITVTRSQVIQTLIPRGSLPKWNEVDLRAADVETATAARF